MTIPMICGPTAAGKTAAACAVFGGKDVLAISLDSMQVYTGMDIGTAKPDPEERSRLEHVMIDCADPRQVWSVGTHLKQTEAWITRARESGRQVVLVGGTGLYVKGLINGLFDGPARDPALRAELEEREKTRPGVLYRELLGRDPETAKRLSQADIRRIIRALEVLTLTGTGITRLQREQTVRNPLKFLLAGLIVDRDELARRIEERVDRMYGAGLVDEVRDLLDSGCHEALPSMQGVGYRETIAFLRGRISLDEARAQCIVNTRSLAQKQIMLFRRIPELVWFHARDHERLAAYLAGGSG
ncbi:MAG TPA: tRNA (adenosine(37)-N6)-dimethylallyltransferase MiaA [Spirochaetota bacterium]|nr:tRNA (adenosine(37)-N6)-dimethylallyltransferase MiaA [Spirochaetota bacterium]